MVCALESRHLRMGRARYHELTRVKKPRLENNILHWPVLLLCAEVMSSDFIEDFCEVDTFSAHLDMISIYCSIVFFLFHSCFRILLQIVFSLIFKTCIQTVRFCPGIRNVFTHVKQLNSITRYPSCLLQFDYGTLYMKNNFIG